MKAWWDPGTSASFSWKELVMVSRDSFVPCSLFISQSLTKAHILQFNPVGISSLEFLLQYRLCPGSGSPCHVLVILLFMSWTLPGSQRNSLCQEVPGTPRSREQSANVLFRTQLPAAVHIPVVKGEAQGSCLEHWSSIPGDERKISSPGPGHVS